MELFGWNTAQVLEPLPSKLKALSSNPFTAKTNKKKELLNISV
jgi:hypothetical protein